MNYLAFDLGGSSGKLILGILEKGKLKLVQIHQFSNQPVSVNGNLYWDILHIYQELCTGIKKAVKYTNDHIDGIGFDSFCNDFVLVSGKEGILAPVYCYRDDRTARSEESCYRIMSREELYQVNGNQMALFNTLNQLHAMFEEGKAWLLNHTDKVLFISDFFVYLLTGKMRTEYTTASVTQMYDYYADDWSEKILEQYGIRKDLFAPLVKPGTFVGRTTDVFNGLIETRGFPVFTVCQHDTASAFLTSFAGEGSIIISTGTWCLVGMETDAPVINRMGFQYNIANEGGFPGGHHRLLKNVMGTWIIQEIVRELQASGREISYGDLEKAALESKRPGAFIDVDDPSFYQPGNMRQKVLNGCDELYGKRPETLGELIYSIYESLAFKYRMTIEQLETLTGKKSSVIHMIGGGIKSGLMCQITANVCNRPVIAGPADATSLGNLIVQMKADGSICSIEKGRELIREMTDAAVYEPDGDPEWNLDYKYFLQKYKNL